MGKKSFRSIYRCFLPFLLALPVLSFGIKVSAQDTAYLKPPTIGLHFFYNDFVTPQRIKATSIGDVISNGNWNNFGNMNGGFGLDYLQGITLHVDAVGNINASWVDYILPSNTLYGSHNLLLDINVGVHTKLFNDRHLFSPFLITKAGYSFYKNINGFSLIPGAGLQVNLFDQILLFTSIEYRVGLSKSLSNQFNYNIGIATNIGPIKQRKPKPKGNTIAEPVMDEVSLLKKDVIVVVSDEPTGQLLPQVEVTLESVNDTRLTAFTDQNGKALFYAVPGNDYFVSGRMNNIEASTAKITKTDFTNSGLQVKASLKHNDPRFTLVGHTIELSTGKPVGGTVVTTTNSTQASTAFATSASKDGAFRTQLEANSDFVIFGKKANYMSNIERISTMGLNRSTTLFVKLQLGIEEVVAGKSIVLDKIYFESGKTNLNTNKSDDLNKLIQFLKDNPEAKLDIIGHTDNVGNRAGNMKLSQQRAASIVNYLVSKGIHKDRLVAKGYGPDQPIESNATAEGKAKNRRVEIKMME